MPEPPSPQDLPWYRQLTRHHWWVLAVACLGWLFDTMDQRIFILARSPALNDLLPEGTSPARVTDYGTIATAVFVVDLWWMMPLLGFCAWGLLGGYAIYFPELFPTRLRATGTGFCYNVGRYVTAGGVLLLGQLVLFYERAGYETPLRPAAMTLAAVYVIGLLALPFAPETRNKPLPE